MENSRDGGERMPAGRHHESEEETVQVEFENKPLLSSQVDLAIWTTGVMSKENARLAARRRAIPQVLQRFACDLSLGDSAAGVERLISCLAPHNLRLEVLGEAKRGEKQR